MNPIFYILAFVGTCFLISRLYGIFLLLLQICLPAKNLLQRYGEQPWALVTGGTDGIGRALVSELSARGINVALTSRNEKKSSQLVQKLRKQYRVKYKVILCDFKDCNKVQFLARFKQLDEVNLAMLINNVGTKHSGDLTSITPQNILQQINTNVLSMTLLTHRFIRNLMGKKHASIINISSFSANVCIPYLATYGASKAYNNLFSLSLSLAYPDIDIISIRPNFVITRPDQESNCSSISAMQCAQGILNRLGWFKESAPTIKHQIIEKILSQLPEWLLQWSSKKQMEKLLSRKK